jgi:hypothetical protein
MNNKDKEIRILADYYKFRIQINIGNKIKDLQTEVGFDLKIFINEKHFLAKIVHPSENTKLILCIKKSRHWIPGEYTFYKYFEDFCADMLNDKPHHHFQSEVLKILAIRIKSFRWRDRD